MIKPKQASGKVLPFPTAQRGIEEQIANWFRRTVESNDEMVNVLRRLRDCCNQLLAGKPVKDSDELLAVVETILRNAEEAKYID